MEEDAKLSRRPFCLNENAKRGLEDLFFFLTHYWGLSLHEKPHREICNLIEGADRDPQTPHVMIVIPRGCYKTSIGRGAVVQRQLRQIYLHDNPYHRIALGSATLALGRASLNVIEGQLRNNKLLQKDYGILWSNGHRGQGMRSKTIDGIILAPRIDRGEISQISEPSFWVASRRRISTGFHADEIWVDDLHNQDNATKIHQREDMKEYFKLLLPILSRTDRAGNPTKMIVTATRYHDDDICGMVMREEAARKMETPEYVSPWRIVQHDAEEEDQDGELYFPAVLTMDVLQKLKEDMGPRLYGANYRNDPVGVNGFIDEDHIRFRDPLEFPPLRNLRCTVDPAFHAIGKKAGCYTAICVIGTDQYARWWVKEATGSREWDTIKFLDALFDVGTRYPGIPVLIEDAHMQHFNYAVRMEEQKRGVRLNVRYIPVDRNKSYYQRWEKIQPLFSRGDIWFSTAIAPSIKAELKDELVRGEAARFNDFLDALALAEAGLRPRIDAAAPVVTERPQSKDGKPITCFEDITEWKGIFSRDKAAKEEWDRKHRQSVMP